MSLQGSDRRRERAPRDRVERGTDDRRRVQRPETIEIRVKCPALERLAERDRHRHTPAANDQAGHRIR